MMGWGEDHVADSRCSFELQVVPNSLYPVTLCLASIEPCSLLSYRETWELFYQQLPPPVLRSVYDLNNL